HIIGELRGRGLMLGIEVGRYARHLQQAALQNGLLLNITNESVVRLLPPLTISTAELGEFLESLSQACRSLPGGVDNG
ncbi:MAG TPA: aminotransferase class III-fold pyridoxal phosphate-dependent enzyme, partial [Candidatus Sulfomarinibacteraceae bacterium]|nr:aminotransferase class III-fold pyridoxal phosphate-dependent enzyme [Candidatus Sulfomarinibacteraceae bacterium]